MEDGCTSNVVMKVSLDEVKEPEVREEDAEEADSTELAEQGENPGLGNGTMDKDGEGSEEEGSEDGDVEVEG